MKIETISYKNIFCKQEKIETRRDAKVFNNQNGMIVEYIGGNQKAYDYVIGGILIATRCGKNEKLLNLLAEHNVSPLDYDAKFKVDEILRAS